MVVRAQRQIYGANYSDTTAPRKNQNVPLIFRSGIMANGPHFVRGGVVDALGHLPTKNVEILFHFCLKKNVEVDVHFDIFFRVKNEKKSLHFFFREMSRRVHDITYNKNEVHWPSSR